MGWYVVWELLSGLLTLLVHNILQSLTYVRMSYGRISRGGISITVLVCVCVVCCSIIKEERSTYVMMRTRSVVMVTWLGLKNAVH